MKSKLIYKILLVFFVLIYAIFTLANQQKVLSQYSKESVALENEINKENEEKEKLTTEKENVNSKEFIEEIARDKLDMYYPNEKIYIDKGL